MVYYTYRLKGFYYQQGKHSQHVIQADAYLDEFIDELGAAAYVYSVRVSVKRAQF